MATALMATDQAIDVDRRSTGVASCPKRDATPWGINSAGPGRVERLTKQHLSRMACASAEEKINEPAGRFLRPRDDIMRPKVLAPAVVP